MTKVTTSRYDQFQNTTPGWCFISIFIISPLFWLDICPTFHVLLFRLDFYLRKSVVTELHFLMWNCPTATASRLESGTSKARVCGFIHRATIALWFYPEPRQPLLNMCKSWCNALAWNFGTNTRSGTKTIFTLITLAHAFRTRLLCT